MKSVTVTQFWGGWNGGQRSANIVRGEQLRSKKRNRLEFFKIYILSDKILIKFMVIDLKFEYYTHFPAETQTPRA